MDRRFAVSLLVAAGCTGCKRREKVRVEPVDENAPEFASAVHMADPQSTHQLVRGFHPVEQNAWRWSQGAFAVALAVPPAADKSGATLSLQFSVPEPVVNKLGPVALTAKIGDKVLGSTTYERAGETRFQAEVPAELLQTEVVTIEFQLSKFLPAGTVDQRELGLVVSTVSLETK